MRMRKMKNLEPRMERCAALRIQAPEEKKGHWRELKPECTQLWVEVGCGKGKFTAETAQANPDVLLIAVERCREAMVVALKLGGPILVLSMLAGILVAIFQAVTQIHEQSLAFIVKLIIVVLILVVAGGWMLETMLDFTRQLFDLMVG